MTGDYDYDLFISHASEDKEGFVRELVALLDARGLRVWFDEAELQVGDSLMQSIDNGLGRSRLGVVVLSRAFFAKHWTRAELDALANREISGGNAVVVLPIWLDVGKEEVQQYSPMLANKIALRSAEGVETIADKLERRVRGTSATGTPAAEPVRLEPSLLRGRILPHIYSPFIQSDDHALTSRAALAARVPTDPEPTLRPATQQLFEDTLAGSLLESFLQGLTSRGRRPSSEHFWDLADPTKTWVITAARPAARMTVDGWTAEGRAAIALKHQPSVVPLGWLILHIDVAIRPLAPPVPDVIEAIPLSLDDLFALVYVPLSALLDEVAPATLPAISGADGDLLAIGCVLMPHKDAFSRYVRFSHYASGQVTGSSDPSAIDWYPASLAEIATPEARTAAIRQRIEGLFTDGGYRGFEREVERLEPPPLRPPVET